MKVVNEAWNSSTIKDKEYNRIMLKLGQLRGPYNVGIDFSLNMFT